MPRCPDTARDGFYMVVIYQWHGSLQMQISAYYYQNQYVAVRALKSMRYGVAEYDGKLYGMQAGLECATGDSRMLMS